MGQQLTPLRLEQLDDGYWLVWNPLKYRLASGEVIEAEAGFITDLQTIPPIAWLFVGHPADDYAESGVLHDKLLKDPSNGLMDGAPPRTRRRCDQVYLEINKDLGCPWWKRTVKYSFVRAFSWRAWNRYREAERN